MFQPYVAFELDGERVWKTEVVKKYVAGRDTSNKQDSLARLG